MIDPFGPRVGALPPLTADIVLVSHDHHDHNFDEAVAGPHELIKAIGEYFFRDVKINGYPTYHDAHQGAERGRNIVYLVEMDGLRLAHLGDLGEPLPEDVAAFLKGSDVLMIPVGRNVTIDVPEINQAIKAVEPKITIPMHYRTAFSAAKTMLEPIDAFCESVGGCPEPIDKLDISGQVTDSGRLVCLTVTV